MSLDITAVRRQFPALGGDWVYFDNAGGSQTLQRVPERIAECLLTHNVQLGASYAESRQAGERLLAARRRMAFFMNAARPEEIVMGPTTTALLRNLAQAMASQLAPGDEIIVSNTDHEVNISPWLELEKQGVRVKFWRYHPDTLALELDDLQGLLGERTRLVTVTHASNILGAVNPVADIARLVHARGARVCIDGVAYAPHRLIDVQDWDVDYYVFSCYKVYGPHHAVMYGKYDHLLALDSLYHRFVGKDKVPNKLEPGNCNYELAHGAAATVDYLEELGAQCGGGPGRAALATAFQAIAEHEQTIGERLLAYLRGKNSVRIIGPSQGDRALRVPTISFVLEGRDSADIAQRIDPHRIGIRYGDFYSCRLVDDLGLRPRNGVVRVSMVHYNTTDEVDRLIRRLDEVI
ncbi:MAG: cysteine desulfurase-like protein [Gammaproteobacteria bacterium]